MEKPNEEVNRNETKQKLSKRSSRRNSHNKEYETETNRAIKFLFIRTLLDKASWLFISSAFV